MSRWGGGDHRGQLGDREKDAERGGQGGRGGDFQAAGLPGGEGRAAVLARATDILFMAPRPARRRPLAPQQLDRRTRRGLWPASTPGQLLREDFLGFGTAWGAPGNSEPQLAGT